LSKNLTCKNCEKLGEGVRADYIEGESLPDEVRQLVIVPGTDGDVSKCPDCGTLYRYYRKTDNDIYNLIDSAEFKRITSVELDAIIESERKRILDIESEIGKFAKKVRGKFGAKRLDALPENEKRIIQYLIRKTWQGEYHEQLERHLELSREVISPLLTELEKEGIIKRKILWPLSPGKYNFQEEQKGGDPVPYTKFSIDDSK
jgi:hypothetical protein